MKKWAAKRADGSIYIIQTNRDPYDFMEDSVNDTLLNEITESNPLPDKKYRDDWADTAGDITLAQADIDTKDRADKLQAIRDYREPLFTEADNETRKHDDGDTNKIGLATDWQTYRTSLRDATDPYKDGNGDPISAVDSINDPATDITWPTKPS